MINFFRKIRYDLMEKNKTGKYLQYAFGEIILVVFGILIALQINNWNENRKLKSQELIILQNFKESLKSDSSYRTISDQQYSKSRNSMDYLIDYMEKDLPYKDSLNYHFGNIAIDWGLRYDFSTYDALKSKDLNLISNDILKSDIIGYYRYAEGVAVSYTKRYADIIEDASKTIFSRYFDQMWSGRFDGRQNEMIPIDYEALKKDIQFSYFLKTLKNQNYWLIELPTKTSEELFNKLIIDIDNEISTLNK